MPVAEQCKSNPSDIMQLILLDILSGRQTIFHLEDWAKEINLEKLIRPGIQPSHINDEAIGRHLGTLQRTNQNQNKFLFSHGPRIYR